MVLSSEGEILFANEAAEQIFGQSLTGKPFGHPLAVGQATELDVRGAQGPRVVEMHSAGLSWQGQEAVLAWFQDVTTLRQSEAWLEGQRNFLERLGQGERLSAVLPGLLELTSCQLAGTRAVCLLPEGSLGLDELPAHLSQDLSQADPRRWEPTRSHLETAVRCSMRLLWSRAILTRGGVRLGLFLLYARSPRTLMPGESHLLESLAQLIALAGERRRSDEALRLSEESYRSIVHVAQEGIVTVDLEGRINYFNHRLSEMLGYREEELLGRPFLDLLDAGGRLGAIRRFLKGRRGAGHQDLDCCFLRQDGTRMWATVSSSPLYDESGAFQGLLGMVADVSARRAAEEELRHSQSRLAELVEALQELANIRLELSPMLSRVAQLALRLTPADGAIVELSGPGKVRIVAGDPETVALPDAPSKTSLSLHVLRTGRILRCDDTESDPRVDRATCRQRGLRSLLAAPLRSVEGLLGVLKVVSRRPGAFGDGDAHSVQLLAESLGALIQRHRDSERLGASEREYRLLFESIPHAAWVQDRETDELLAVNESAVARYGYAREELLAMKSAQIEVDEGRHRLRNGELREVELQGDDIDFQGRPARLVLIEDVTSRRAAERELVRMNRALQTLGSCHEAVSQATSEDELLGEICRIAVEIGGYQLAWVGYAGQDAEQSIIPRASFGESNYPQTIKLSWGPQGSGPAAEAIRAGRASIIPDVTREPSLAPWREQLASCGYQALVALPLGQAEQRFGFLALYCAEKRPFPEEEVRLLRELSDALSVGIGNLRLRKRQRRMQEAMVAMVRGVSATGHSEHLDLLTRSLTEALSAPIGLVAQFGPERHQLRTLSLWVDGEPREPFSCEIPDAYLGVLDQPVWLFPRDVRKRFPDLPWTEDIEALAGARLVDSRGELVGLVAVLFREPLTEVDLVTSTLQILASRAGAELERQKAEARVREQASLLDKAQDAIFVQHLDQRITYWNRSAERLYGWSAEEVLGRSLPELFAHDSQVVQTATATVLESGEWMGEVRQVTREGREIVVESRWTLVHDQAGKAQAFLSINTDVTERKALEMQFLRAQRLESIGTLAGGIAHDLNNVLTPIMVSIELLAMGARSPEQLELLSTLRKSTRRGANMVQQVLSFARGVEVQRGPVNLTAMAEELGKFARETFDRNILVRLRLEPDLWPIQGDSTQIHQLLLNLCVNSRDAMPTGGELLIAAQNVTVDTQFAATQPGALPGRYVCLEVRDQGEGMSQEVMQRMFEPFFTTKEVGKGTGLGLSTVQAVAKGHAGFTQVESRPGRGTAIRVYLPVCSEKAPSERPEPESEMPRGRNELVLVVDDEPAVRTTTARTLEVFGYRVLVASDGAEAIAIFAMHSEEIALVLTDMMMPVMDGFATIRALQRVNPGVLLVASSGLGVSGERAASLGVRHFLAKPYTAGVLLRRVRLALDEAGSNGSAP